MLLTKVLCCPLAGAEGKVGVQLIVTIQWKERKTSQFWNAVPVPSLLPDIFLFLSYLVKLGINCISTIGKFYFFFLFSLNAFFMQMFWACDDIHSHIFYLISDPCSQVFS